VHTDPDLNAPPALAWMRSLHPDVVFCLGWSRLLQRGVLAVAPMGVIGYHPAALPENRGRHPFIWALVLGLERTGSTFFFMDEGADSGDIVSQTPFEIGPDDDAATLYARMTATALSQLTEIVPQLAAASITRRPQDHSRANSWRKRSKADGRIDWRMPARGIHDLVRALAKPYPGAHFEHGGREHKVWNARVVASAQRNMEPGKVLRADTEGVLVRAGEDAVLLLRVEPPIETRPGEYL
jgi:methionyl-tRNA formyltransferase